MIANRIRRFIRRRSKRGRQERALNELYRRQRMAARGGLGRESLRLLGEIRRLEKELR